MIDTFSDCDCNEIRCVKAELEGRIRGLEALLIEIPEVTPERIIAAKERIRERERQRDRGRGRCKTLELFNQPFDKHAEAELDALLYMVENR